LNVPRRARFISLRHRPIRSLRSLRARFARSGLRPLGGTALLFCTTGILLRRLAAGLGHATHIIVDEVHERSVDTDFLLAVLRLVLRARRDVRVLLMSATMDAGAFARYFAAALPARAPPVPALAVPGFTHPVTDVFLEQALALTGYRPAMARERAGEPDLRAWKSHGLDYGLVAAVVQAVVNGGGGVLPTAGGGTGTGQ
jgi:HrpA-like RNA helicase